MVMVVANPRTDTSAARFRVPPWDDSHPNKLDIEQRLSPDHLARIIDAAVERLDLSALRAAYHGTGSAAHPPERLLRVVLFEMHEGHHCPSQWFKASRECEPVRWLLRGAVVARTCWYDFRDRVGPLLPALHKEVLTQAIDAGLTPATRAAQDGTTVAANASRHKVVNQETLRRRSEQLATVMADDPPATKGRGTATASASSTVARASASPTAGLEVSSPQRGAVATMPTTEPAQTPAAQPNVMPKGMDSAAEAGRALLAGPAPAETAVARPSVTPEEAQPPAAAGPASSARPAWIAPTPAGRQQQQQRLERAQKRMDELHRRNSEKWKSKQKAADAIVVSLGDPETVVGRDKEKVFRPLYNVQILDDLDSPLILGYEVFAQQNDTGVLGKMLERTRQQLGHGLRVLLADGSYAGGADLAAAEAEKVTVYAPVPGDGVEDPKQIPKREFSWQADQQAYVCPQGHLMVLEESWKEKRVDGGVQVSRYRCPPEHCQGCPQQPRCTAKPTSGRAVTRLEHEELIEALRARMTQPESQTLYRLRKQTVELVNADMKEHRKLRRFSGRGLTRARCEVGLMVLTHNLLTLVKEEQKAKAKQARVAAAKAETNGT
jgi:transposase